MDNLGQVNEQSTAQLTLTFLDEEGSPVIPISGSYRIDTVAGISLRGDTSFSPTASTHTILLTVDDNTIEDTSLSSEPRIITVTWQYGVAKQGTIEYRYSVKNLKNII